MQLLMCQEYVETLVCVHVTRHTCCLHFSLLCRPWDCTSFLNLSSKCATSPVSCCWDSVAGGGEDRGVKGGVEIGEKKGEK